MESILKKIRIYRKSIASCYDACAVLFAWLISCSILFYSSEFITKAIPSTLLIKNYWHIIFLNLLWILPLQIALFHAAGLYRGFWRFASIKDLKKILWVCLLGSVSILCVNYISNKLPSSSALLYGILLIAMLATARLSIRLVGEHGKMKKNCRRVIIAGAGNAGEGLVRDLLRDETRNYQPIAFVDDDLNKQGREIHTIRVAGTIADIPTLVTKYNINLVFIAIPSASSASMRSIINICEQSNVRFFTLPGLSDLADGRVSINVLRNISLEDLLGRYPITAQWEAAKSRLAKKTILVTGGGGSIGSELCRQIASAKDVSQLIVLDNNEFSLYSIDMELRKKSPNCKIQCILMSITDEIGISQLFKRYRPQIVFHAAAYKHVPLLEYQARIAIYNNIIGTRIIAEAAMQFGIEKFVLISSDKAVNPTNIMGATKRAAEYFCQNSSNASNKEKHNTQFITVRFGNVLGSTGSVVPLFKKQIEEGGPVTVTHPDIMRFFMTIPEAAQLILQAAFLGKGGEIFILDMGDPIRIRYLAEKMIQLAGKKLGQDISIIYTGLRPGEKLYEECFYPKEKLLPTENPKILRAQSQTRDLKEIYRFIQQLEAQCNNANFQLNDLILLLKQLVPDYVTTQEKEKENIC